VPVQLTALVDTQDAQPVEGPSTKATLLFSVVLLFLLQTLTVWVESIYKISLTRLAPGAEALGLLFVLSPLGVFLCPERAQQRLLTGALVGFVFCRLWLPFAGAVGGVIVSGAGVGAALVCLCLLLSRPFRFLQGDAGSALGLALVMSIALRAWGASFDSSLGRSGALIGWILGGLALGLYWKLSATERAEEHAAKPSMRRALGPMLGLAGSLTLGYMVLSSPSVVEGWLGFDNTEGVMVCAAALGVAVVLLGRGMQPSRFVLTVWNLLFAAALVGGILALRIRFPETPASPAVVVRPDNTVARVLLNLMFLLSPAVLFNARAMCRSLGAFNRARTLALPLVVGIALLLVLAVTAILTNVWGYVGAVSAIFRNQFHVPFLLGSLLMTGPLFLPSVRRGLWANRPAPGPRGVAGVAVVLVLLALGGAWHYRPGAAGVAAPQSKRMTVLSYNLQQGAALDGRRNWENQLALLRKIDADIVGLQESDTPRPSNGHVCAAKYFGAKLGYHIYHGPNTVSGTYGTAVLSRFPLKHPRTIFTFSNEDEISTAAVECEVDGKTFAIFNSHPSGRIPKQCHAEELVRQAKPYDYAIAMGDYNTRPNEDGYRTITAQLKDSWLERYPDGIGLLHPELRPQGAIRPHGSSGRILPADDRIAMPDRIDHIFVSKALKVTEAFYLPSPASETDHPAHWVTLTWD